MITLDGDFHMMYYRTDVLEAAGKAAAEDLGRVPRRRQAAVHGQDMNGDGTPDFGSCIAKKRNAQSYWFVTDVVGSMTQSKGTSQGTFFNTADMTPLVDNAAFRKALEFLQGLDRVRAAGRAQPRRLRHPAAVRLGPLRAQPRLGRRRHHLDRPEPVEGDGQVGRGDHAGLRRRCSNWETGELVACDAETCPHAIDGVNHAPFAAFGGWGGGINAAADPKVKDAAYAFFSFMTQPAQSNSDVTIGGTGFNPYRTSQLAYSDLWKNAGMSEEEAEVYLGAINASMSSPNMILDLRIPQNQRYQQVVLDEAISRFLVGRDRRRGDGQGGRHRLERAHRRDRPRRAARVLPRDDRRPRELRRTGGAAPAAPPHRMTARTPETARSA